MSMFLSVDEIDWFGSVLVDALILWPLCLGWVLFVIFLWGFPDLHHHNHLDGSPYMLMLLFCTTYQEKIRISFLALTAALRFLNGMLLLNSCSFVRYNSQNLVMILHIALPIFVFFHCRCSY